MEEEAFSTNSAGKTECSHLEEGDWTLTIRYIQKLTQMDRRPKYKSSSYYILRRKQKHKSVT